MAEMTSTKPYLFRGIYEWIEDNGLTPYIVVDALTQGVLVPQEHVNDGQITLNVSSSSIELYQMSNKMLHFSARFNGLAQELTIPIRAILGIYARENGQGMFFEAEDYPEDGDTEDPVTILEEVTVEESSQPVAEDSKPNKPAPHKPTSNRPRKKGTNRDSSHLKIIK